MPEAGEHQAVADHLAEATLELERVDLNVLSDEQVLTVLRAKRALREVCLTHRRRQHTRERNE